ncbi:MAG TPA: DUF1761 domain-containing protein [Candidatus Nanoarchaeia archaeon]|nr:DUF1761 domain-containing protein [Candidatus Nanoarchaeia archaeon]
MTLSILIAAIAGIVIGGLWYGPLFGKTWIKLMGITPKQIKECKKKSMGKSYAMCFIGQVITAYVLSMFIQIVGAKTAPSGAMIGFWAWLGFTAMSQLNIVIWEGKSWQLFWLNALHYLVALLVMGGILGAWM